MRAAGVGKIGRAVSWAVAVSLLGAGAGEAQIYTRVNSDGVIEATNLPNEADFHLTYPGKGTLIHSRGFRGTYHGEFDHFVSAAARAHGVPADVVRAVIAVESDFDHLAVSSKGAQGLMQLMPFTARRFGVGDAFDPRQNIFGGARYLRFLLDLFNGDLSRALAGYNAGENAVIRYNGVPPYKETRNYVRKVRDLLAAPAPLSYAPARLRAAGAAPRPARLTPARPRIYYRWQDGGGSLHVSTVPPPDGTVYSMIRALH
jgi:Transglycosylase SLT domain